MKKEYFNIPNLMGYFRILLIPVFLVLYFRADTDAGLFAAFCVLAVSYLTDFLDGKIARKFHMVTDFGKALDPAADKLTQGALAIALTFRYPLAVRLIEVFLIKEAYMAAMGVFLIKKGFRVHGAKWYGKVCTAVLDIVIFLLLFMPGDNILRGNLLMLAAMIVMTVTLCAYIRFHVRILRRKEEKKPLGRAKCVGIAVAGIAVFALYVAAGAYLPYLEQPEVSSAYRENFRVEDFYGQSGDADFCDRAAVIEDNGEALQERIRLISNAQESIVMSTFDFRSDEAGKQMIAALRAAAQRGVRVQILVDGFNSRLRMSGDPYFYALAAEEDVEIKIYNAVNPLIPWKGMSRMHDKYLLVDERVYILGGRNTFNYFLGDQEGHKNYDRDVLVYNEAQGEESSVYQVLDYFHGIWNLNCCDSWLEGSRSGWIPSVKKAKRELTELYDSMMQEHPEWFEQTDYIQRTMPVNKITLLTGPTNLYSKQPQLFYSLCALMAEAKEEVWIHTPYIICNDMMYEAFRQLCGGDADIILMTNSITNNGNPFGAVDYAMNKERILETGLRVLEYEGGISYHGKSIVIDDTISMIGSFNMDMKSVYQDTELMLVIDGAEFTQTFKAELTEYQQDAPEAVYTGTEMEELFSDEFSLKKKIQRGIIRLVDPWLRIVM